MLPSEAGVHDSDSVTGEPGVTENAMGSISRPSVRGSGSTSASTGSDPVAPSGSCTRTFMVRAWPTATSPNSSHGDCWNLAKTRVAPREDLELLSDVLLAPVVAAAPAAAAESMLLLSTLAPPNCCADGAFVTTKFSWFWMVAMVCFLVARLETFFSCQRGNANGCQGRLLLDPHALHLCLLARSLALSIDRIGREGRSIEFWRLCLRWCWGRDPDIKARMSEGGAGETA